jgi:hypothetical protein
MKDNNSNNNNEKIEKKEEKDTKKEYKSIATLIIVGSVFCILFLVISFVKQYNILNFDNFSVNKKENEIKSMASEFYSDYYYTELKKTKSDKEMKEFLTKFKDFGVKIDLNSLLSYGSGKNKDKANIFKNKKGKDCDGVLSRAIIYPKSPYGKNDYSIKVELKCE